MPSRTQPPLTSALPCPCLCPQEVLDETQTFVESSKKRQERLAARQEDIKQSLSGLREDLLAEVTAQVEDGLLGVKRGGKTLEKALRQIRQTWEDEVNDLVNEAKVRPRHCSPAVAIAPSHDNQLLMRDEERARDADMHADCSPYRGCVLSAG